MTTPHILSVILPSIYIAPMHDDLSYFLESLSFNQTKLDVFLFIMDEYRYKLH